MNVIFVKKPKTFKIIEHVVSQTRCTFCHPLLRQRFQVATSIVFLKGFTKENMYYNVYKKPSVNLKKEIWEEGEQMREN